MSATIKGKGRQSRPEGVSEGGDVFLRHLRDGSIVINNWKDAAVLQGLAFMVNVGAFSSPITGGGDGLALDQDQPELALSIPSGKSIRPLRIEVCCAVPILTADSQEAEILIAVDQDQATTAGGTGTTETIYNMNTLKGAASACTAVSGITANLTTAPTLDLELMHKLRVVDFGDATGLSLPELYGLYEPDGPEVINGPALLLIYWGGSVAVTGFAVVKWVEFDTSSSTI